MDQKSNSFNLDLFRTTYRGPTVRVKLAVMEDADQYLPTARFKSSAQVGEYFSPLQEEPREILIALHLDNKHHAISIEEVSKGILDSTLFDPKTILQSTILANAASLIVIHNHPSGDPAPSPQDIQVTKNLKTLMDMLPIRLLDHVIIGRNRYFSLADAGYL